MSILRLVKWLLDIESDDDGVEDASASETTSDVAEAEPSDDVGKVAGTDEQKAALKTDVTS